MLQNQNECGLRRHDLLYLSPRKWEARLRADAHLAHDALLHDWAARGWPLVARRYGLQETAGVPAGLPLPPQHGKRRLVFLLQAGDVLSITPAPLLRAAGAVAPIEWRQTLQSLFALETLYKIQFRVYGSLSWRFLTGLDYLAPQSDLDLIAPLFARVNVEALSHDLTEIENNARMRLDGEFVIADGSAVNWREIQLGRSSLLVKTMHAAYLLDRSQFLEKARSYA